MTMTVVAMTREMGSLGKDVALKLAGELGLKLVSHQIVGHIADKMHVGRIEVNRFLEGSAGRLKRWGISDSEISAYTIDEILEIATHGDTLIRGWGASYVLRPVSHVLCVRVCAPIEFRTRVLMKRIGSMDQNHAQREILKNDAAHARLMKRMFHVDCKDPSLYDIVLNTERESVADCVRIIKGMLQSPAFHETRQSREHLRKMWIEARVRLALKESPVHWRTSHLDIEAAISNAVRVSLKGVVNNEETRRAAEIVALTVPGVAEIDNQLMIPGHYSGG